MQRHDEPDRIGDRAAETFDQTRPGIRVGDVVVVVDVERRWIARREAGLSPRLVDRVLVRGDDERGIDAESGGDAIGDEACIVDGRRSRFRRIGEQVVTPPQRFAVVTPHDAELPAGEWFARVPLALPVLDQPAGREPLAQPQREVERERSLRLAVGGRVPFGSLHVVDRHERRFAAHREAHVAGVEALVDLLAEFVDARPLLGRVRQRDPRVLPDAMHHVGELEGDLGAAGGARDRRRGGGVRRARQRDVSFAGEQPRRGVEADPSRSGDVDLRPGVEVGEVRLRPVGAAQRRLVGGQLDEVAGREPCGEPEVSQRLHEEPPGVAAGTDAASERLVGRLHSRFHPDRVLDVAVEPLVQSDEEVGDRRGCGRHADAGQPLLQSRPDRAGRPQVWLEVERELRFVDERERLRRFLDEEVERVDHGQVGDEVDRDVEHLRRLREHEPGHEVAERILLPVDEVLARRDAQAVRQNRCPAVRRGTQPDHLRMDLNSAVETVCRAMFDADVNAHSARPVRMVAVYR